MFVDMHIHERTFSDDSMLSLDEIVSIAREKGLDAVCITDHDSIGIKNYAEEYSERVKFPIFVGFECYTLQGDITAWGVDAVPETRIDAQDFIDTVNAADGFCIACHPFRSNRRGLEEHLMCVRGLHGIEVLNGSTDAEANGKALRYCTELGLKPFGASDAHVPEQVGKYAAWLPEHVGTLADFIRVLRSCTPCPAVWNGRGYEIIKN